MLYWLMQHPWMLLQYPGEVLLDALILWAILNRMAPPRLVIEDPAEAAEGRIAKPVLRRIRQFSFAKCLGCALMLFVVLSVAMAPIMLFSILGLVAGPVMLLGVGAWFFGSRWAVSTVFEWSSPGQQAVIALIFIPVSLGAGMLLGWGIRMLGGG